MRISKIDNNKPNNVCEDRTKEDKCKKRDSQEKLKF